MTWSAVCLCDDGSGCVVLCDDMDHAEWEKDRMKIGGTRRVAMTRNDDPASLIRKEWGCKEWGCKEVTVHDRRKENK